MNQVARRTDDRDGTATARRPLRSAPSAPAAKRESRGSFDLGAWVHGVLDRSEETPCEPFKQGLVRRDRAQPQPPTAAHAKPTCAAERAQPPTAAHTKPTRAAERAQPPTAAHAKPTRAPERSLDNQSLARWAFGLVGQGEEAPPTPPAAPRPSARRKALTMPDLFDGGAVPPCLQDD